MHRLLVLFLLALLVGCPPSLGNGPGAGDDDDATSGDDDDDATSGDDDDTVDPDRLPIGVECVEDDQCVSGVCWDFADYDPWCGGAVCSSRCEAREECQLLADAAGASSPDSALCGADGLCDFLGTGLGSFWCADGTDP